MFYRVKEKIHNFAANFLGQPKGKSTIECYFYVNTSERNICFSSINNSVDMCGNNIAIICPKILYSFYEIPLPNGVVVKIDTLESALCSAKILIELNCFNVIIFNNFLLLPLEKEYELDLTNNNHSIYYDRCRYIAAALNYFKRKNLRKSIVLIFIENLEAAYKAEIEIMQNFCKRL